jgi:hypothetical protein
MASRDIVDACGSTFNNVGRDQITINQTNIVNISLSDPTLTIPFLKPNEDQPPPRNASPRASPQRTHCSSTSYTSEAVDITTGLIATILCLFRGGPSLEHQHLEIELKWLCQSLLLTRMAVLGYTHTPLGPGLAKTINPEVERCQAVLQELLNGFKGTWQGLESTSISNLWPQVWWSGDDDLRIKLAACRKSTDVFLMALNSYGFYSFFICHRPLILPIPL